MSRIAPRLVSVLVTRRRARRVRGRRADLAPEGVPARAGQDEPLLPEFLPDGQPIPDDGAAVGAHLHAAAASTPATRTLEIQFLLHGAGPASEWAERAKPGDKLAVAGPGGRFVMDAGAEHWWLAADESRDPGRRHAARGAPAAAAAEVHIEVDRRR